MLTRTIAPALTVFFIALLCCAYASPAQAKWSETIPKYFDVPVFFITDRETRGRTFGPNRKYKVNCKHDPYYGELHYPIKNTKRKQVSSKLDELTWQAQQKRDFPKPSSSVFSPDDPKLAQETFFERLEDAVEKSGHKDLFVFVHGTNNDFDSALEKAAKFEYYAEAPLLLYSWPSVGRLSYYRVDVGNIGWSMEHFRTFKNQLHQFKKGRDIKIHLIMHSLGCRIVSWSLDDSEQVFDDIQFICPDIDSETFAHYLKAFVHDPKRIRLYISGKDRVLPISQMLYGGYYRLGAGVGDFFSVVSNPALSADVALDTTKEWLEDPLSFLDPNDDGDKDETTGKRRQSETVQTIDFTRVDRGILGHKVPFELVVNMCKYNKPGPGLILVPARLGERGFWTKFIRWSYNFSAPPAGAIGSCEKVHKLEDQ